MSQYESFEMLINDNENMILRIVIEKFLSPRRHCVKSVHVWSYSGLHFPAFGLNTEWYGVCLPIQSECGKMWTRTTANKETFHAVSILWGKSCDCKYTSKHSMGVSQGLYYSFLRAFILNYICERPRLNL